ncbi:MAG: GC-type dockerin domain-anchored protein [Phycisphaerales bacterium]
MITPSHHSRSLPLACVVASSLACAGAHANVVTTFHFVGVTYPAGTVTGTFTYDFTAHHYTTVQIVFPGGVTAIGSACCSPVSISPSSISASVNSDTIGYDMQLQLATPFTPTTGAEIAIDPPGTPLPDLNSFIAVDFFGNQTTYPITAGSIQPVLPCVADLNGDHVVNAADLSVLLGQWATSGSADLNGDGVVNAADLAALLGAWGACP